MANVDVLSIVRHLFDAAKYDFEPIYVAALSFVPPRERDEARARREREREERRLARMRASNPEGAFDRQDVERTWYRRDVVDKLPPAPHAIGLAWVKAHRFQTLDEVILEENQFKWLLLVRWPSGMTKVAMEETSLVALLAQCGERARKACHLETAEQIGDELVRVMMNVEDDKIAAYIDEKLDRTVHDYFRADLQILPKFDTMRKAVDDDLAEKIKARGEKKKSRRVGRLNPNAYPDYRG